MASRGEEPSETSLTNMGELSSELGIPLRALQRHPRHELLLFHPRWHVADDDEESFCCCASPFNLTRTTFYNPSTGAKVHWYSRDHRKGRFGRVGTAVGQKVERPRVKLWGFESRNISWWVAQLFLWGSVAWVLNGHFLLFPEHGPSESFNLYFTCYAALVGGTLFWVGAYLAVVEALNIAKEVRFGHEAQCGLEASELGVQHKGAKGKQGEPSPRKWHLFFAESYRLHDIGYASAMIQLAGATLFTVSTILGVPGVLALESDTNSVTWDASFWSLQVVGAWGFIISSVMFCLEVQHRWWLPRPCSIGWQVGFWNLIGGLGFELSPIFGYWAFPSGLYQRYGTYLATYCGGWAFLIGSYLQLLEVLNKHPIELSR